VGELEGAGEGEDEGGVGRSGVGGGGEEGGGEGASGDAAGEGRVGVDVEFEEVEEWVGNEVDGAV